MSHTTAWYTKLFGLKKLAGHFFLYKFALWLIAHSLDKFGGMNIYTREKAREKVVKGRATDVETFEFVETLLKENISKLPGAAPTQSLQVLTSRAKLFSSFTIIYCWKICFLKTFYTNLHIENDLKPKNKLTNKRKGRVFSLPKTAKPLILLLT